MSVYTNAYKFSFYHFGNENELSVETCIKDGKWPNLDYKA